MRLLNIIAAISVLVAAAGDTLRAGSVTAKKKTLCLLLEPRIMGHKTARPIPRAKETHLVPGIVGDFGVEPLRTEAFTALGLTWEAFLTRATTTAEKHFKTLKPKIVKDPDGNTLCIILRSENPLTSSVIFAPSFRSKFEKILGTRLLVAIPDRTTVYVFPRGFASLTGAGKDLATLYLTSTYPASSELFEINDKGILAAGTFLGENK